MAWWIVQHIATTALLAMMVALVCRVTRMGPVARHALWVLVLIKFVTPPLVAWPWTLPDPLGLSVVATDSFIERSVPDQTPLPADTLVQTAEITPGVPAPAGGEAGDHTTSDRSVWSWIAGLWLSGSIVLAVVEGIRLVRLTRRTRAAWPAPADLTARVARHAARLGLAPVPIVLVDGACTPSVWGLFRPRLLWPAPLAADVPEIGTDGLIVHELAHVKRRDHLVGWIELAGGVIWWWNPLFWSVRSALREQAELACDAWVISALPDGRRAYAEALLALSSEGAESVPSSMAVVGIRAATRRALERRLVMIMKGRTSLRLTSVGVCSLVVIAAAALPTWAASSQMPQPPAGVPSPALVRVMTPPAPSAPQAVATPQSRPTSAPPRAQTPTRRAVVAPRPSGEPARVVVPQVYRGRAMTTPGLPEAARALAEAFNKEQQTYLEEMMRKVSARRDLFHTELQRLQEEYTKAGNLDDAVAIRDYLRRAASTPLRATTGRGGRGGGAR